jgi:dihydrofolate reductase
VFVVIRAVPRGWPREDAPFTFIIDGIESALTPAGTAAGDGAVGVGGADFARQFLNAGLLGEVRVDLCCLVVASACSTT